MLGETIRIGYDGKAVSRGVRRTLGALSGLGRGLGRALRQTTIGAFRQVGASIVGMIVRAFSAIPNEIKSLASLKNTLDGLSGAADITREDFLILRDSMERVLNVDPKQAEQLLVRLQTSLSKAITDADSTEFKALQNLGVRLGALAEHGDDLGGVMQQIGTHVKSLSEDQRKLLLPDLQKILGMRSARILTVFQDYEKITEKSRQNTKALNDELEKSDDSLGNLQESFVNIRTAFSVMSLRIFEAVNQVLNQALGKDTMKTLEDVLISIMDSLVGEIAPFISGFLVDFMKAVQDKKLGEFFKEQLAGIGSVLVSLFEPSIQRLGEMLKETLQSVINEFPILGFLNRGGGGESGGGAGGAGGAGGGSGGGENILSGIKDLFTVISTPKASILGGITGFLKDGPSGAADGIKEPLESGMNALPIPPLSKETLQSRITDLFSGITTPKLATPESNQQQDIKPIVSGMESIKRDMKTYFGFGHQQPNIATYQ